VKIRLSIACRGSLNTRHLCIGYFFTSFFYYIGAGRTQYTRNLSNVLRPSNVLKTSLTTIGMCQGLAGLRPAIDIVKMQSRARIFIIYCKQFLKILFSMFFGLLSKKVFNKESMYKKIFTKGDLRLDIFC